MGWKTLTPILFTEDWNCNIKRQSPVVTCEINFVMFLSVCLERWRGLSKLSMFKHLFSKYTDLKMFLFTYFYCWIHEQLSHDSPLQKIKIKKSIQRNSPITSLCYSCKRLLSLYTVDYGPGLAHEAFWLHSSRIWRSKASCASPCP